MIEAVIFDMDGVIIDSEPLHFESHKLTMRDFGIEITDDELYNYMGISNSVMWKDFSKKYRLSCSVTELLEHQKKHNKYLFESKKLEPIKGIQELLDKLVCDNIKIALASSSSKVFIKMILNNLNIIKFFIVIVSGEEVQHSKPSPEIFIKTAKLLNIYTSNCLVIEDSEHGIKAAKLAGMKCIGFKNPNSGNQRLNLADTIVDSIGGIDYKNY
jgi:HAD superfamily hydrolase (TIGR01509 family)